MREMKDSGIEWIGKVPVEWKIDNPQYHFSQRKDRAKQGMVQLTASQKYGVITQTEYMERTGANIVTVQKDFDILKLVCAGDFVIHMRSFQGGLEYSEKTGSISSAYVMLIPSNTIREPRYYKWFFKSSNYIDALSSTSNLVRDGQAMRWSNFIQLPILFPPAEEQQRIADFLDAKCAEIDALTADIQTQIDTLEQYKRSVITETVTKGLNPDAEMKDSGVFYMAPMNASWGLTKIGYICTKLSRSFVPEDTALICSNKGKVQVRADDLTGIMVSDDNAMQGIRAGDIAIHGMDTWHGAIALSEFDGKITRVVHVCDSTEDKRFIVYYMQHLAFQGVYKLISNGVRGNTSDFRSWDKVRDIWIAIPKTRQEQKAICDYLDRRCNAVEEVISTKKQQLEVLADYKKSLIFEYVTGKKEVSLS